MYKHNNLVSINTGERRPILQEKKMQQNKYSPWTYKNRNRYYNYPPVSTDYAENPKLVLQKIEYAVAKIQRMDIHHRNSNRYYTQPAYKHRLCRKSWTCSTENRICSSRNIAHGHTSQKQQQIHHFSLGLNRCINFLWVWRFKFVLRVFVF